MKKIDNVIKAQQFDLETVESIFKTAAEMKLGHQNDLLKNKIMAALFYEPSTRTRLSFESAMIRLGGRVIGTENAREFSSKAKGESLEDSVRVISGYSDLIVLRYHKEGGAERAQRFAQVPIINAGDGTEQHPTQALLDIFTIKEHFGNIEGLTIALVGDLTNGRTVRSLCYFLAKHYPKNKIYLVSPAQTKIKDDIKEYLDKYQVVWQETENLEPILPEVDVIYQTRVQKERFQNDQTLYEQVVESAKKLNVTEKTLRLMKTDAIIMHPLPRVHEIDYAVDKNHRAHYFQQAQNGVYIRMALLKMILVGY